MKRTNGRGRAGLLALLLAVLALTGAAPALAAETAEENKSPVLVDGYELEAKGYIINGSSYFRLRDFGDALGFGVGWDAEKGAIVIDTGPLHEMEDALNQELENANQISVAQTELAKKMEQQVYDMRAQVGFIPILCVAIGVILLAFLLYALKVKRTLLLPLREAEDTAKSWPEEQTEEFRERVLSIPGAPGSILREPMVRLQRTEEKYRALLETAQQRGEEEAQDKIARQICDTLLPCPTMGDVRLAAYVAAAGAVYTGAKRDCVLFDYFPIKDNRLFFAVAQAQGENAAAASCVAMAMLALRSEMDACRDLADTLSDINAQIHALPGAVPLCVFAGTLNTVTGSVFYVNAGGTAPLFMRSGETYEWLEGAVSAPLGQNAQSDYREERLSLRQGDRIFLYTDGLGSAINPEGECFRAQQLRTVLNQSRNETRSAEELPAYVKAETLTFCGGEAAMPCYAALVLEYRRGTKEFAFCTVRPRPSFAPEVLEFLKRRCQEYGIAPKGYARLMVVADELFALCCRRSIRDDLCRVECSLAPDGQLVNVKMIASLGGKNPLVNVQETVDVNAIAFIRENTEYVKFEPGAERDTLTAIYALETPPSPPSPADKA